jgi:hypothetical protein
VILPLKDLLSDMDTVEFLCSDEDIPEAHKLDCAELYAVQFTE